MDNCPELRPEARRPTPTGHASTFLTRELAPILEAPSGRGLLAPVLPVLVVRLPRPQRRRGQGGGRRLPRPYLSTFAKRHLKEHTEVSTLDDFRELLDSPDADKALVS